MTEVDQARAPITMQPIGVIRTPFTDMANTPIQPLAASGVPGQIEVWPEFADGLADLEGFSHITLVYCFHRISGYALRVVPFMDTNERGIFATKAPKRPNRIGLSTVRLRAVRGHLLEVEDVDMLDGTPLLDIKPFYPRFDNREDARIGWLEPARDLPLEQLKADNRFAD